MLGMLWRQRLWTHWTLERVHVCEQLLIGLAQLSVGDFELSRTHCLRAMQLLPMGGIAPSISELLLLRRLQLLPVCSLAAGAGKLLQRERKVGIQLRKPARVAAASMQARHGTRCQVEVESAKLA